MGMFIKVELQGEVDPETARRLVQACPVDIFVWDGQQLKVDEAEEDECTLCDLCVQMLPPGAVRIRKLYEEE